MAFCASWAPSRSARPTAPSRALLAYMVL